MLFVLFCCCSYALILIIVTTWGGGEKEKNSKTIQNILGKQVTCCHEIWLKKKNVGQINSSFFNSKIILFSFLNNSTQTILGIAAFFSTSENILVSWIEPLQRTPGYILPSPHLCASTSWQFCPQHRSWIPSMPRSAGQVWLRSYAYKYSYEILQPH